MAITSFRDNYFFLSNFFPCKINYEYLVYPSAEHAYQAAKSFDDGEKRYIATLPKPGDAKRYGRQILYLRKDWEFVKTSIMLDIVRVKFCNNDLRTLLLATKSIEIIEGNQWHDNFWGICTCGGCSNGQNILGKILMLVREEIQQEK